MMTTIDLLIAGTTLVALTLLLASALIAWQGWLAFKDRELELAHVAPQTSDPQRLPREGAARIELADLKERVRRLEAIANGVDL